LAGAASDEHQAEPYDLFADAAAADPAPAEAAPAAAGPSRSQPVAATPPEALVADLDDTDREPLSARHAEAPLASRSETHASQEQPSEYVQQAIAVFNASEFPRRVAGVTRSLGAPAVTVRSAEHLDSVVSIVVAWELCWYRYEVDLSEPVVEAQVIAQGTELSELAREDRLANAAAAESGMLLLPAA
jgi:hypothetical protein